MNNYEVGQKVWDTHNNRVYTLKSSEQKYGTTMWQVEENEFEWREDWFGDIPRYVQELIDKAEATEKRLQQLEQDVKRFMQIKATHLTLGDEWDDYEYSELYQKLSKVGKEV